MRLEKGEGLNDWVKKVDDNFPPKDLFPSKRKIYKQRECPKEWQWYKEKEERQIHELWGKMKNIRKAL